MRITACLTVALLLAAATVSAETIYDNFDVGDVYSPYSYLLTSFSPPTTPPDVDTHDNDLAMAFTVASGGGELFALGQIDLAVFWHSGENELDVTLTTDLGGVPGLVMETWHVSGLDADPGSMTPTTLVSVTEPNLADGQTYWVVVSASGPSDSWLSWHLNSIGAIAPLATIALVNGSGSWNTTSYDAPALRVLGRQQVIGAEEAAWGEVKALYR